MSRGELAGVRLPVCRERRRRGDRQRRCDGAELDARGRGQADQGAGERASLTDDPRNAEALTSLASAGTAPVERPPLTALFRDVPAEHGGQGGEFSFGLEFSESFPGRLPYRKVREEALPAVDEGDNGGAARGGGGRTRAGS